jgi:hypothetical protein
MIIIKPLGSKNNSKLLPSNPLGEPGIILLYKLPFVPSIRQPMEKGAPVSTALLSPLPLLVCKRNPTHNFYYSW